MRKVIYTALSLIFISALLLGCQTKENTSNDTAPTPSIETENDNKLSVDSDFKSINISKQKGINEIIFDDKESLKAFQDIFSSAVKEAGVVDMADPEFYLNLFYDKENHQSLYLWIGEKGQRSTIMKTEDTHTIYTVSEEKTDILIELVESQFN